jgi:chromosome segregation ATPase
MAPLPDAKHLLELLQRAADELKASQKETQAAKAEARALQDRLAAAEQDLTEERRQRERLDQQLRDIGTTTLPPGAMSRLEVPAKTVPFAKSPVVRDEKTSVGGDDPALLGERMQGLQDEIATLETERRELKDKLKAAHEQVQTLEAELAQPRESPDATRRLGELEHELSNVRQQLIVEQARGADLLTRLHAWEARSQELEHSLAQSRQAGDEEHGQLEQLAGQLSQVETELTTERARTQAMEEQLRSLEQGSSDEQKRLFEATSRIAQLEVELSGLKSRRDELNVEIGKAENERNAARARATELEHAAEQVREQLTAAHQQALDVEHHKRSELEQQLSREKDKHQITAQKLLEARGKQRELEEQVQQHTATVAQLRGTLERQAAEHQKAITLHETDRAQTVADLESAHAASVRGLQDQVATLTQQLEQATTEWRHVERQYEQLHREMLVILDQRDEARRELDAIRQRLGLR